MSVITYYPGITHQKNQLTYNPGTGLLSMQILGAIDPTQPFVSNLSSIFSDSNFNLRLVPKNTFFGLGWPNNVISTSLGFSAIHISTVVTVGTVTCSVTGALGGHEFCMVHATDSTLNRPFQSSNVFSGLATGNYVVLVRLISSPLVNDAVYRAVDGALAGIATETDTTSTDGTDGTITVDITSGSGDYTVIVNGVTQHSVTENIFTFSGLPANTYDVDISDGITGQEIHIPIVVNDPTIVAPAEDFFFVPPMQSLQFIHEVDPSTDGYLQTMDNVRFCRRVETSPIWVKHNYYQKICTADKRTIQWQSNYENHEVTLLDFTTGEVIEDYLFSQKIQNVGLGELFDITLSDNLIPGQTRVVFNDYSTFPVVIAVGDVFSVSANADGLDGNYTVLSIGFDSVKSTQYLVVGKIYTAGPTSAGNGLFFTTLVPFNIFESEIDFSDLTDGLYYLRIRAIKLDGTGEAIPGLGEPLSVKSSHPKTNLVEFYNVDAAFDINYSTGIKNYIRVESNNFQRDPAAILNTLRNTSGESKMLRFLPQRKFLLQTYNLPPWMHEKLAVAFGMDFISLQGVQVKTEEVYANPSYIDTFDLSDSSINLEQDWFKTYNTNNLNPNNKSGKSFQYFDSSVFTPDFQ